MASTAQPRECTVTKKDGAGYGFFLRIEKDENGHLIRSVQKDSSAEKAGLKDGDRVLRVNGKYVDDDAHASVVDLIKSCGNSVTLQVLDEAAYESAKKRGENLSNLNQNSPQTSKETANTAAKPPDSGPKPRLCYLSKQGRPYGFSVKTVQGATGLFLTALAPNGVAEKSGVREGDRLIEINGKNVENDKHDQLTKKVKDSGENVMFLLTDKETEEYFKKKNMKITADKATVQLLPLKPRTAELKKGANGYGFYLRQEKNRKGQFVMDIDVGSPAEKAKLKDFDRIVAVNGQSVELLEHEEVVKAIQNGGDKTTLLVVDKKTDELYTMAGVSPFLFLKELEEQKKGGTKDAVTTVVTVLASVPVKTPSSAPDPKYKPRLCRLQKSSNGYGFHLNAIQEVAGQFIKQVVKGGVADKAGVKEDDILLEVNGVNVEKEAYEDVVMKIRDAGKTMTLLVITQEAFDYLTAQKIPIKASLADPLPENDNPPSYFESTAGTTAALAKTTTPASTTPASTTAAATPTPAKTAAAATPTPATTEAVVITATTAAAATPTPATTTAPAATPATTAAAASPTSATTTAPAATPATTAAAATPTPAAATPAATAAASTPTPAATAAAATPTPATTAPAATPATTNVPTSEPKPAPATTQASAAATTASKARSAPEPIEMQTSTAKDASKANEDNDDDTSL